VGNINKTHGEARKTKEYRTWCGMKNRCYNEKVKGFTRYGGRGITVCDRWKDLYINFSNDMGRCPEGFSLDRIDNNKEYSPNNCRWASKKDQARNRRNSVFIDKNGMKKLLIQEVEENNMNYHTTYRRIRRGANVTGGTVQQ
jgi:hypothetical protein